IPQIPAYGHAAAARDCTQKHSVLDLHPEYEPLYEPGGWNWCLTNPETQRVLRDLIVEMLEDFGHPPYIHLGCDEAQPPTCPECRKRPYGELVCEHIANLAAFTKEHGARAMIWHDMLLDRDDPRWDGFVKFGSKLTATLADTLPKDVIVCDWQYSYKDMKEARKDWPTIAHFREKGFDVVGCPWMNFNAMKPMADFLAKVGGFGMIETTWHHLRGKDWVNMYRRASSAAWGTPARGATPHCDTEFATLLRMVGHDMKTTDYLDTGHLNYQVPPGWWVDNN
ncbi:MAG: family 20 glycosylhydrolase, partial [Kiritimatiellae bacterium]|nr:family 20 glycosylhydrolase [Kiritimatiellia bacterium]